MSNNDHKPRLPPESKTNVGVPTVNRPNSFPVVKIGPDGSVTHETRDNSNNNDNDHSTTVTSDGGFTSKNFDSDPKRNSLDLSLSPGSVREYSNNKSRTTNANDDTNVGGNRKKTVKVDSGSETGNNDVMVVGGTKVTMAKDNVEFTPKRSQNNKQKVTSGNDNEKVTGSKNCSVEGDCFNSTGESRYDIVKNGEYGINVQSGNMDCQVDSGRARISASKEILLICGSSYVKILPDSIEIVANRIDLNP